MTAERNEQILYALGRMDPENEAQWTQDGAPRLAVVADLAGLPDLKRPEITDLAPKFSRQNPEVATLPPENVGELPDEPTLDYEVAQATAALDDARSAMEVAQARFQTAQLARDRVIAAREGQRDPQANQKAIMAYLESQKAQREERARKAGVLAPAPAKSKLDQAMSRQTGYGRDRPQV